MSLSWRDELVDAVLPVEEAGLPRSERAAFWARFDTTAPASLRLVVWAAALLIGVLWPLLHGAGTRLARVKPARRDALLVRARALPGLRDLVEVARVVSCFAVFSDPKVEDAVRGRR